LAQAPAATGAPGTANGTAPAAEAEAPASGSVAIAVQPWATIYVDGVEKGITPPLKKLTLPAGVHEVRLENPNFPPHVQKITVDGKKPVTLRHEFGK
jgi:non-specific serine/threonine protein kinase